MILHVNIREAAVHLRHAEVVVEAQFEWPRFQRFGPVCRTTAKTEVPFAEAGRGVTGVLEHLCQREFVRVDQQWLSMTARPPDPFAKRILPGQQGIARRRADRGSRMRVREAPTFFRQAINVRRLHLRRAITTQIPVTEIVGKNKHHIRGSPSRTGDCRSIAMRLGRGDLNHKGKEDTKSCKE